MRTLSLPARTLQFGVAISILLLFSSGCISGSPHSPGPGGQAASTTPAQQPASSGQAIPAIAPGSNRFGVFISRYETASPEVVNAVKETGAAWVRINLDLGPHSQDYSPYLASGINVVLTICNQDPSNIITTYGTLQDWSFASFPFKSREKYMEQVRISLQPALPYLQKGQQVWVQAGNEIFDASNYPKNYYWRGTDEQYLTQLEAMYDAVKSVDANIPVVISSFSTELLDVLIEPHNPNHADFTDHVTTLLTKGKFDAVDLHFYGCAADIPAKVSAVRNLMPQGRQLLWICTENGGPDFRCSRTPVSWKQDLAGFENLQALQVPVRLSLCADNGATICLWFSLYDLKNSPDIFSHLGLLDQDTNPPRKKPAYAAFTAFVARHK
jgi:hypothetical protein